MWDWFWAIVGIVGAFAGVALIVYFQWRGPTDHESEEAARAHFDRTGRWPEEGAGPPPLSAPSSSAARARPPARRRRGGH